MAQDLERFSDFKANVGSFLFRHGWCSRATISSGGVRKPEMFHGFHGLVDRGAQQSRTDTRVSVAHELLRIGWQVR